MRKLLLICIIPVVLMLIGCSKGQDTINPGIYEIKFELKSEGQDVVLKEHVQYNPDGTYEGINYVNNTPVQEFKGKYKIEKGRLVSFDKSEREPLRDAYGWTEWQSKETSSVAVKDIQKTSYQYLLEPKNEEEKAKYAAVGITEGWKTYNRISK